MLQWSKNNDVLGTVNRGNPCESGLCTLCESSCKGRCETWMSSLRGRHLLYPRKFGETTAGSANVTSVGVGYHALRIQGYAYGAHGLPEGTDPDPDNCLFTGVNTETSFGTDLKTSCRIPIMTGALGSSFVAAKYWESFAVGAALGGFPIVIGENVVGVDRESVIENGKTKSSPELQKRIDTFLRYHDGQGAIFVQLNVEDTRNGVAEFLSEHYADKVIMELKWGQGAKDIGGEIQLADIEYARFLKDRGYLVDPDPYDKAVEAAFREGGVKAFARHSRLGGTNLGSTDAVRDDFMDTVAWLRKLGFKRVSLKTGAYGMEALAMALRYASDAGLDLLTVDGAGGGTGMSPWNMMDHWGVPSLPLHVKTIEYARLLEQAGRPVPDLSLAGGFAREDHIFKALALGAPYVKMVCMGRAPMIPGFLGSNIEGVLKPERREAVHGHWEDLPSNVTQFGTLPQEIFACWEEVQAKVGADEMANIPFGAIAMVNYADKLRCGLQQFMAGARKYRLQDITRDDLMSANRETEAETGIPYMTEALDAKAKAVLAG